MTDISNYTWNYNDFDNYNEYDSYYNTEDYVFDHTNIFVLNRKKNAMELRHDLMAMYIYIVILFTFWLVNYFLEISSPHYRVYVNELAYNRFGMRIYDRVGIEVSTSDSDSEGETETEGETEEDSSESEDDDTYSESDSEEETDTEPDEASEEEDSDTDYEVDISNHIDPTAGCFRLD